MDEKQTATQLFQAFDFGQRMMLLSHWPRFLELQASMLSGCTHPDGNVLQHVATHAAKTVLFENRWRTMLNNEVIAVVNAKPSGQQDSPIDFLGGCTCKHPENHPHSTQVTGDPAPAASRRHDESNESSLQDS
jgi:hypothetical protein